MASILLVLSPACAIGAPELASDEQAIIGGEEADSADFSTVVALEAGPGEWFCTGTLIHQEWVLTAAHCVEGESPATLKIRFDDTDVTDTEGGQELAVAEIIAHPDYSNSNELAENDIAVIRLDFAMDRAITPVNRAAPAIGTSFVQVGYGVANDSMESDDGSGLLRSVSVVSIDCAATEDPSILGDRLLCFDQANKGTGTCFGDSGGPTFIEVDGERRVAGVTSFGTQELCSASIGVETLVSAELDFVDQHVPLVSDGDRSDGGGCTTSGKTSGSAIWLALAVLVTRRRRAAIGA